MNNNDQAGRAADHAEVAMHGKVKEIVMAEGIEYADALERVWYDPGNAELVTAYRDFSSDDEDPETPGTLLPFDAGLEAGKRVRGYMADYDMTHQVAVNAVLAADAVLKTAWDADLKLGAF